MTFEPRREGTEMPTFDTPEPISVTIFIGTGDVRLAASDRDDTVVEVRPSDESDEVDVRAAERTRVEFAGGRLTVKTPSDVARKIWGRGGSIDVVVRLPSGSRVEADVASEVRAEGRLGDCTVKTSDGDIWLDEAGKLRLDTADGDITVARSSGQADATTANGDIRIGAIGGPAMIKTANGDITLGEAAGHLRLHTAYGDIVIDRADSSVVAKTATGGIRVGAVARGTVVLDTAAGDLEVGIPEGTAAWLDVSTSYGTVRNLLTPAGAPGSGEETVEVRARTSYGDILIRRP
jgi:DUF4097 and DUF4098 domain-containing protein YvlB